MTKLLRSTFLFLCLTMAANVFSKPDDTNNDIHIKNDSPQFIPPVADFTTNGICTNEAVTLTDLSTNTPTTWLWTIVPSVVFQNGTDANSQNPQAIFTMSGEYNITLEASNLDGTNTITKSVNAYGMETAPYTQDFSGGTLPSEWFIINPDASEGWEFATSTGIDGNPTPVARMDNYQYNAAGQLDELVMPSIDLTMMTNPKLYFDVAYARFDASNFERLHIEYSTDCGANFSVTGYDKESDVLATFPDQGNGWGPSDPSHWRTEVVDLAAYKSSGTILKFIQTAGYGNGLFINNVRIGTDDPATADFTFAASCSPTTVMLTDASFDFPSSWSWTFSPPTVTFLNGTDASSQNPEIQFDAIGNYTATLTATNAAGSSSITKDIASYGMETAPYFQDFSGGVPPSEWFIINPDASESWELATSTGIDGNPTQVARMDNYQYNAAGQLDELVMPSIDLTLMTNPKLYFDVAYARFDASNFERLHIEYSTDCGTNFSVAGYDKQSDVLATVPDQGNGWEPSDGSHWRTDSLDLTAYKTSASVILKFIQTAGYGNGLFIDNIRVGESIDLPVELTRFEGHSKDCNINLNWTAASEENFKYYEIQRSTDTRYFSTIAIIESEGGIHSHDYHYMDKTAKRNNYYRLKMVDIDESYEYSEIIFIDKLCNRNKDGIKIFPNPIRQKKSLQIEFYSSSEEEEILCMNVQGIIVKKITYPSEPGWNTRTLDISHLPRGTYYIHIGKHTEKLVII